MKRAISLPDGAAERYDEIARRHGMTRSEFYRRAAEQYADRLTRADVTSQIDVAIAVVGQPGDDLVEWRREGNSRIVDTSDGW